MKTRYVLLLAMALAVAPAVVFAGIIDKAIGEESAASAGGHTQMTSVVPGLGGDLSPGDIVVGLTNDAAGHLPTMAIGNIDKNPAPASRGCNNCHATATVAAWSASASLVQADNPTAITGSALGGEPFRAENVQVFNLHSDGVNSAHFAATAGSWEHFSGLYYGYGISGSA